LLDRAFLVNPNPDLALSLAFVAVQGGRIVAERYGPGVNARTKLTSWSVAKSITQSFVGLAMADGAVDLDATPAAPEWADADDPRHAISLRHLMAMRSGLEFNEDYVDAGESHCLEMLFGEGAADMAGFAASQALAAPVDTLFNYSSGSTNIVSRAISSALGLDRAGTDAYLHERLFDPIGMGGAEPHYDGSGTFVGSSYVYATARDFARYGLLHLRDGMWEGRRILPEGWVDVARTARSGPDDDGEYYGAFWWVWGDDHGTFAAQGYEGQLVAVVPDLDLVLVRLGKSPIAHRPALFEFYRDVISAFDR
jgi:CubicO group peptidase (beta-lactamase class C family)